MKTQFVLFALIFSLSSAYCAEVDTSKFSERYPIDSIKDEKRAHLVIEAYEKEKAQWNEWKAEKYKECYRNFLVNHCQSSVREEHQLHMNDAHDVWVQARNFLRAQRAQESTKRRAENEQKQAKKIREHEAQQATQVAEDGSNDEGVKPQSNSPRTTSSLPKNEARVLTEEQQKKNELEYQKKQEQRQKRIEEERTKEKPVPSSTLEEREKERDARRKAAQEKREANIRKRQQKALEYERQLRLREEQKNNDAIEDITPKL